MTNSSWVNCILGEFQSDLSRLWIVSDPDGVLLDEHVLAGLRERGFETLLFEDSIAFRAEYEERYRTAWDQGEAPPSDALILHLRGHQAGELPWDYLRHGRRLSLSLAELLPKLSYSVVRQLDNEMLPSLFEAQAQHASQVLGEAATKEFVLTHIFELSPHLIKQPEHFWRELLRLHYRESTLPTVLAQYVEQVLGSQSAFRDAPIAELFSNRSQTLRVVQDAWYRYLEKHGLTGNRVGEPSPPELNVKLEIPFNHHDVWLIVDSMFLDGTLHPLEVSGISDALPKWAKVGVVQNPLAMRTLVLDGIKALEDEIPGIDSSHRDWAHFARRLGEIISRFNGLDASRAAGLRNDLLALQCQADTQLQGWLVKHYSDLPSLPVVKGPIMLHHVPRFLSIRREHGEQKIALLLFDGLAIDQWIQVRESVTKAQPRLMFDEQACFAWLPTLTSVSRQALFSGLRPREFADSIETTSKEPGLWDRFWRDHGLTSREVFYRKAIKRNDDLPDLEAELSNPAVKVAGIVVDTVDEMIHGAVLGKSGVAAQITKWCESGFIERLFQILLGNGFSIYLTADHGNVEAVGIGRPNQGLAPELRGERVRAYRSEALLAEALAGNPDAFKLDVGGLPTDFMPLFAGGRGAFVPKDDQIVVHGGPSVEELIVPFVKVSYVD